MAGWPVPPKFLTVANIHGIETPKTEENETMAPDWNQGTSGDGKPAVWTHYNNKARHYDDDLIKDLNNTLDTLLLFAGLFIAAVSAIITQTYPLLQPDDMKSLLRETQKPGSTLEDDFTPPPYAVRVNCLLFNSLLISMVVALLAILVKQWTRGYQRDLQGVSSPHLLARTRHFRFQGASRWFFSEFVSGLSVIMHLSLFLTAVAILDLLHAVNPNLAYYCLVVPTLGAAVFIGTTFIGVVAEDSPFRTPLATGLKYPINWIQSGSLSNLEEKDEEEREELFYSDISRRKESILVGKKAELDIHIIIYLLRHSDPSTERGILDQCFLKLPELNALFHKSPTAVLDHHEDLFKAYRFLASGCTVIRKVEEISSGRLGRARNLCSFLAWYLTLQRLPKQRARMREYFDNWQECDRLPNILMNDTAQLASYIPAVRAIGRLNHLIDKGDDPNQCELCSNRDNELKTKWSSVSTSQRDAAQTREFMLDTTAFIVISTDCLVFRSNFGFFPNEDNLLAAGRHGILEIVKNDTKAYILSPSEKRDWVTYFKQAEGMANDSTWIKEVLEILNPSTSKK